MTAAAGFWSGNCGSGSELGSGDAAEKAGPAYTSTAGRLAGADACVTFPCEEEEEEEGRPWCLRPVAEAVAADGGGDLLAVPGLQGLRCAARILCGCGCGCRMLCGRRTSVAMRTEVGGRREGGRGVESAAG